MAEVRESRFPNVNAGLIAAPKGAGQTRKVKAMYAVIRTGGKQYRVAPDDIIEIEKIDGEIGETVAFDDVLMLADDAETKIGTPLVAGASVAAEVLDQGRGDKIIVFKKKRRQNYRRKKGHRQDLTIIRILEIVADGKTFKAVAKPKADKTKTEKVAEKAPEVAKAKAGAASKSKAKPAEKEPKEEAAGSAAQPQPGEGSGGADVAKPGKAKAGKSASSAPATSSAKPASAQAPAFTRLDAPEGEVDDLKLLTGVGPKLAQRLNDYGIYHFWQIAALTADQQAEIDAELSLKGRLERDGWVAEAGRFAAGEAKPEKTAKGGAAKAKKSATKKD